MQGVCCWFGLVGCMHAGVGGGTCACGGGRLRLGVALTATQNSLALFVVSVWRFGSEQRFFNPASCDSNAMD